LSVAKTITAKAVLTERVDLLLLQFTMIVMAIGLALWGVLALLSAYATAAPMILLLAVIAPFLILLAIWKNMLVRHTAKKVQEELRLSKDYAVRVTS
jgi:uncharacterized membrane protein